MKNQTIPSHGLSPALYRRRFGIRPEEVVLFAGARHVGEQEEKVMMETPARYRTTRG